MLDRVNSGRLAERSRVDDVWLTCGLDDTAKDLRLQLRYPAYLVPLFRRDGDVPIEVGLVRREHRCSPFKASLRRLEGYLLHVERGFSLSRVL